MAKRLQLRGGTTSEHESFTGAVREVTVDTDKKTVVVHDGSTLGGFPVGAEVAIDGASLIYVNQEVTYTITNYDSFAAYSVSVDSGTVTIADEVITVTAPASSGSVILTVTKDGVDTEKTITIGAAGVTTPTNISPANGSVDIGEGQELTADAFQ